MTLHPDILTDLVILYHAGEASQATRTLLEEEASNNPQIASALAAGSRFSGPPPLLPLLAAADERKVLRKVRLRSQLIAFAVLWVLGLVAIIFLPLLASKFGGLEIAINLVPFALLILFFLGVAGALYFLLRILLRAKR